MKNKEIIIIHKASEMTIYLTFVLQIIRQNNLPPLQLIEFLSNKASMKVECEYKKTFLLQHIGIIL